MSCRKYISAEENYLCHTCQTQIFVNKTLACAFCRRRLADNKKVCHRQTPYLLAAATFYDDPAVKNLIWQLKYRRQRAAAAPLSKILTEHARHLALPDLVGRKSLIIPMPLHPIREKERGFNQSRLIAEQVAHNIGLPIGEPLLKKRHHRPQAEVEDFAKRKENVAGSFEVADPALVKGKNIVLVDDVSTSGATLQEAAAVLKSAGAKKIIGLVIARAF